MSHTIAYQWQDHINNSQHTKQISANPEEGCLQDLRGILLLFSIFVWCLWWAIFCTRCVARTPNKLTKSYCPRSLTFFILAWQLWQRSHIHQCLVVTINLLKNFNMYSNSLPSFNVNRTLHTLSFSNGIQLRALGAQVEGKNAQKCSFGHWKINTF